MGNGRPCPKPKKREKAPRKPLKRSSPARRKGAHAKTRLPSIKRLRETADEIFSRLVRERDGKCVITGRTDQLQAAHFYGKKARPSVRYDFMNVHALTAGKHMETDRHDPGIYQDWMRAHYPPDLLDLLEANSRRIEKRARRYYEGLIAYLQDLTPEDVYAATWPHLAGHMEEPSHGI